MSTCFVTRVPHFSHFFFSQPIQPRCSSNTRMQARKLPGSSMDALQATGSMQAPRCHYTISPHGSCSSPSSVTTLSGTAQAGPGTLFLFCKTNETAAFVGGERRLIICKGELQNYSKYKTHLT